MAIRPILSTLGRHKTAAGLIALEIALTCAIVSNAVFLIGNRLERMAQPSGMAESELIYVQLVGIERNGNPEALMRTDLAALRDLPGVRSASSINQIPFSSSSWNSSLNLEADQTHPTVNVTTYFGSESLLETLGLRLLAGRGFESDEYRNFDDLLAPDSEASVPSAIITRALAERLFPDRQALGATLYWIDNPVRVVGVVDRLLRPRHLEWGPSEWEHAVLFPVHAPTLYGSNYLLRVDADRRAEMLEAAVATLEDINPNRIVLESGTKSLEQFRHEYHQQDRAMAGLLVAVSIALLLVTALGIVGLASFWVQQRTHQIGVRRALGATRGQILRYFQTENFLIATLGIVLGMGLAFSINGLLMERYELPRLPWHYLPIGALALWLLGQCAVLGPALRAAAVPPAVATRSG